MGASTLLDSPARTGDLILKTRIALVIRNLQQLQCALVTVKQRRVHLREVLMFPERANALTDELGEAFNNVAASYETSSWGEVEKGLKKISEQLQKLKDSATALECSVEELRRAATLETAELARTEIVTNAIHESLKSAVRAEFGEELTKLETLRGTIDAAKGGNGPNAARAMQTAWSQYMDSLHKSSERLFEEYVDLVSGVAIRDAGLDRGISRLAEGLLERGERIGSFISNTLTIPARDEALAVTAARIVRLGFPEWTIWTLPLAAYELGANYADSDKQVTDMIAAHMAAYGGKPEDKPELNVLVADAFATFFLGPAYACAAILMRLNPAEAFSGNRLVAKRAAIILSVLSRMSEKASGVEDHYAEIMSRLAVEWGDALRQTGWDGSVEGDAADQSYGLRRLTGLTAKEQAGIEDLISAFEPLVYAWIVADITVWPRVEEWAAELRRRKELLESDLGEKAEMRYVLNAAWRARIAVRAPATETDIDDPTDLVDIAQAIERLLWSLVRPPKEKTAASETGQKPPPHIPRYKSDRRAQTGKDTA